MSSREIFTFRGKIDQIGNQFGLVVVLAIIRGAGRSESELYKRSVGLGPRGEF